MGKMSELHIEISEYFGEEQPSQAQIDTYMKAKRKVKRAQNKIEKLIKAIYNDPDHLHEVVVSYAMEQLRS